MGKHTAYWQQYQRTQVRGSLRILGAIVAWILVSILIVVAQEQIGRAFPWAMGIALAGLTVSLVVIGKDAYKVKCPECNAEYKRRKWGGQCPSCGLKLLQHEP